LLTTLLHAVQCLQCALVGIVSASVVGMTTKPSTRTILHAELRDGMIAHVQGYRFRVTDLRIAARAGDPQGIHQEPYRADVIRYTGVCVDDCDISATSYNGGRYGAYADVPIAIDAE
jgi:hypothetical protein